MLKVDNLRIYGNGNATQQPYCRRLTFPLAENNGNFRGKYWPFTRNYLNLIQNRVLYVSRGPTNILIYTAEEIMGFCRVVGM